jgi:hypothetical protein
MIRKGEHIFVPPISITKIFGEQITSGQRTRSSWWNHGTRLVEGFKNGLGFTSSLLLLLITAGPILMPKSPRSRVCAVHTVRHSQGDSKANPSRQVNNFLIQSIRPAHHHGEPHESRVVREVSDNAGVGL